VLTSFHKMLVHGADIVSVAILPTGQTQEFRKKTQKYFGRSHSRKSFTSSTNEDVLVWENCLKRLPKHSCQKH